jgi:hypothetical protein
MINKKIIIENKEVENKLNELLLKINFVKNNFKNIDILFNNDNNNLIDNIDNCLKLIDKNIIQNGYLMRNKINIEL